MNKIMKWLTPRTTYVWHDVNEESPPEEGRYLVIREHHGKLGSAHFDLYCADHGWVQTLDSRIGMVVLWTESPEIPEQVKK